MAYSPNNEQGLLSLVAALKAGMDPATGVQMLGMIEQDQAEQVARRQQRLGGLADLLMGAAQSGMSYEGAEALAEAAPGPAGPAVDQMMSSLYPTHEAMPAAEDFGALGSFQQEQAQVQSPVYQPDPMADLQVAQAEQSLATGELEMQQQMAAVESQQAMQAATPDLMSDASKYARDGRPINEFMTVATQAYPEFFVSEEGIALFQQIVSTAYAGTGTVSG